MKNQKAVYLLLPVVLIVWGAIFYKIYFGIKGNDLQRTFKVPEKVVQEKSREIETYNLSLNYRDPFLKSDVGKHLQRKRVVK